MSNYPRKLLSVRSVAARYECHPSSVWRWVAQRKFPAPIHIGGMTRWLEAEVDAYDAQAASQRQPIPA